MTNSVEMLSLLQKRYGSADWSRWQVLRWSFYDYVRLNSAGVTQVSFFQNPLGSTDPVSTLAKTLEDTNMNSAGTFGQVYFICVEIRTHIRFLTKDRQPTGISDDADLISTTLAGATDGLLTLMQHGVLLFNIGQKAYYDIERPFLAAPPGFGLTFYQNAAATGTVSTLASQSPYKRDTYQLTPPQVVEPQQTFTMQVNFDAATPVFTNTVSSATPRMQIGVILDGYLARPAQ